MWNQQQTTRDIPTVASKRCPTPIFRHGGQDITNWTWSYLCQWHSTNFLLGRSSASVRPFFTLIEEFAFFWLCGYWSIFSLIRILETRWLPCHANAAARGQLRKIHRDALNQHSKVCTHNQNNLSKLCVLLLRRHKIIWTWRNISMLVECS